MSRRVYLLGVGLALVALAFAATDSLLTPPPGVTEANCRRIRVGMLRAEIERLLGGHGISLGKYPPNPRCQWNYRFPWTNKEWRESVAWVCEAGGIEVTFDEAGRAVRTYRVWNGEPGLLSRLRAWLGW
jgi:hypothetical protein